MHLNLLSSFSGCTSTSHWFDGFKGTGIDWLDCLDTSSVTDMSYMFSGCENLGTVDLSHFNTSNVTNMAGMFSCSNFSNLDLSHFDTSSVTDMSFMFDDCFVTNLDLSSFDTSKVKNMSSMFSWWSNMSTPDISHFDTSNVTDMSYMFYNSNLDLLTSLDLSHFNTSNVTDMSYMFGCDDPFVNNSVFDINYGSDNFNNIYSGKNDNKYYATNVFHSLDLSNFDFRKVEKSDGMFSARKKLNQLKISPTMNNLGELACHGIADANEPCVIIAPEGFDFGVDTGGPYFIWKGGYFRFVGSPLPYAVYNDNELTFYYDNLSESRTGNIYCPLSDKAWKTNNIDVHRVIFDSTFSLAKLNDLSDWFSNMSNLSDVNGIEYLNTSEVTNMSRMFMGCNSLETLDLSSFDTSKLTSSTKMLSNCTGLERLVISSTMTNLASDACEGIGQDEPCEIFAPYNFDFGVDTSYDFFMWKKGYFKLGAIASPYALLSEDETTLTYYFDTNSNKRIGTIYILDNSDTNPAWYSQRASITKVVFDPSFANFTPTSTYGWFRGMENLEEIEGLEYLDTSETTLMSYMFYGCFKLKSIDVSRFDTKNVEKMGYMFQNCTSLERIDISNFDYSNNTSCYRMFNGCTNLKTINTGEWKNNVNDQFGYLFSGCSSLESLDLSQLNLPSDAKTTSMLNGCSSLRSLIISPSMSVMNSAACSGVGSATNPCDITAPDDFAYGVDTSVEPFRWKSGYFRLASKLLAEASDVKFGNVYDLRISLRNGSHVYNGYQFNVHLPEGFDLTGKPRAGYDYTLSNRYATTPTIRITLQDDGSYQVLAYSTNNATITGSEGLIITLPLTVGEGLAEGNYAGTITDVTFNNPDNTSAYLQDADFNIFVPAFGMGDVNHDRSINITDVMMTVNHVVGQTPSGFHVEDADINGDHVVNISDIMAIVNLLVSASTANAPAIMREAMTDAITLAPTNDGYAVSLKNNEPYTALQMDIQMLNDAPLNARLTDNRSDGHTVICNDLGNGHHRIVVYSLNGHALKGNDGILLQLQTNGKRNDIPEIYDVQLTNRLFESVKLSDISIPTDITIINDDGGDDSPAYNVQGIRAPKHHRGIIIQNGRKRVEKK